MQLLRHIGGGGEDFAIALAGPTDNDSDMPIPDPQGRINIKPSRNLVPAKYATAEESPLRQTVAEGRNTIPIELKD